MAKATFSAGIPADAPAEEGDGVVHAEADYFAQEQRGRGFGVGLGGEHAIGAAKGDRVRAGEPGPDDLGEKAPFTNARSGK